jgi:hypothetical protein
MPSSTVSGVLVILVSPDETAVLTGSASSSYSEGPEAGVQAGAVLEVESLGVIVEGLLPSGDLRLAYRLPRGRWFSQKVVKAVFHSPLTLRQPAASTQRLRPPETEAIVRRGSRPRAMRKHWTPETTLLSTQTSREPVNAGSLLIGETGFEPATARPPAEGFWCLWVLVARVYWVWMLLSAPELRSLWTPNWTPNRSEPGSSADRQLAVHPARSTAVDCILMASTDRTVHVGQRTYALLRAEAERRHRDVDATADDLLAERLSSAVANTKRLQDTLERAASLRAGLPRTNQAVYLVREGREELETRAMRR